MGSGGVAIAALPTVICLKVPFSDGLRVNCIYISCATKKTPYYQTNNYWKDGFYQIPKGYDFTKGELIEISTDNIKIIK